MNHAVPLDELVKFLPAGRPTAMEDPRSSDFRQAVDGLTYPSETDASIVPFRWQRQPGETALQAAIAHSPESCPVQVLSLQDLFEALQATEDGKRFTMLRSLLEERLQEPVVIRTGSPRVTIHVIGIEDDDWAGVSTVSVET